MCLCRCLLCAACVVEIVVDVCCLLFYVCSVLFVVCCLLCDVWWLVVRYVLFVRRLLCVC